MHDKLHHDDWDEVSLKNNEPNWKYATKRKKGVDSVSLLPHYFSDCAAINIVKIIFKTAFIFLAFLLCNAVSKIIVALLFRVLSVF